MESEVTIPIVQNLVVEVPWLVRLVVGVLGLVVLAWGARIYKPALVMVSFGAGAVGAAAALDALSTPMPALDRPEVVIVGALVAGAAVAAVAVAAHKLALLGVGALAGVVFAGAVGALLPPETFPWWGVLIGALVGAVALPFAFPALLKIATPAVGAVLVAWALGRPDQLWVIGGLWILGALFQLGFVREREEEEEEQ
ncbi:MAG: DUF4203 domain-containing protein [Deltaproteobacteria bacterium]|nr:DUF4203 domain-containing protein [Deltaproteobacteria bacterium]